MADVPIPTEFMSKKEEVRRNIAGIKQALLAGQERPFAHLERGYRISIR